MNLHNNCQQQQLSGSNSARPPTFWTICPTCGTKFQYHHAILKKAVCCQNCSKAFIAHALTEQHVPFGPYQQFAELWISAGVYSEIRLLRKFEPGQIWALYSDIDKFPNYYVFIEKVDLENNEVQARWLEAFPDEEVDQRLVVDPTVGCGTYRVSTTCGIMIYTDTKPFSHPVHAAFIGRRNSYEIYPRKDEVWALLRGWDIGWSSDAHNQKNYNYEVVQVLSDFTTGTSITVMPLVKIKVFVSLFMQDKEATAYLIPQDDPIWFSHSLPYRFMGAAESEGIPEGALELDPAALPLNLEDALASVVPERSSGKGQEFGIVYTRSAVEGTDVDEESGDIIQAKFVCPDSEFYDFTEIRLLCKFKPGQIWALYNDIYYFPNYYAIIKKVDVKNNKVTLRWLLVCPEGMEEKRLVKEDHPVGCGTFRVSTGNDGISTCTRTAYFSHPVPGIPTGIRNEYEIFPRLRDVWAVYKDWRAGWTAQDFKNCDYI
ncbi:unnamed protein product [Triticum aestivum]|uniref:DUF3444 domain-containing protein n=1 Tax=Triticum aestivum TaxID=4565 RepID=A0A7H4LBT5_WHEAT|nr:unnamed protein product [Triticum aestivum]